MALIDEMRMDRTVMSVVTTETPSDANAYWQTKSMEERLEALELTRQVFNGYDPDTTGMERVLDMQRAFGRVDGRSEIDGHRFSWWSAVAGTGSA